MKFVFAFALILLLPIAACAAAPSTAFHPPQTEAEKALDHILMLHTQDKEYRNFFTSALEKSIDDVEARLVKENCGGQYLEGELCGLDYTVLTCAQDVDDSYIPLRRRCGGWWIVLVVILRVSTIRAGHRNLQEPAPVQC